MNGKTSNGRSFPLVAPEMSFAVQSHRNCNIDANSTSHSFTSESVMYGLLLFLSDGLLHWTLTYSTLQNSFPPNGTAPNIQTLSGLPAVWKMGFMLPPPAWPKRLLSRLKLGTPSPLHTTAGPDSFQSDAHFSPHFLYIIYTIKYIKPKASQCTVPWT